MDKISPAERSENMRRIRSRNTAPEKILQKLIQTLRYRYTLHAEELPGRPDFVFLRQRKVVFLHGCFWHIHGRCKIARLPKSKRSYWIPKLKGNKQRDKKNLAKLRRLGWKVMTVWECQLRDMGRVEERLRMFLRKNSVD